MSKIITIFGVLITSLTLQANAETDKCKIPVLADHTCFQYGSDWGKTLVPDKSTFEGPSQLMPAYKGTFQTMVGGSGILLGVFKGEYVAATAYHTCVKATGGKCGPIHLNPNFRYLGLRASAKSILGQWPELDLVLFTITVDTPEAKIALDGVGRNFAFRSDIKENMLLTVAGYSPVENPKGFLQITEDSDCRVLSRTNDFRLLKDPDSLQPDKEKKWAFAMGCDVARGDSGGPVLDRISGSVVGLVWTGTYPVDPKLQTSVVIKEALNYFPDFTWTKFAYSVPAPKLLEGIESSIKDSKTGSKEREILAAISAP